MANGPDPPSVTVIFPNGGERLAGEIVISWTAEDPDPGETELLETALEYSPDSGSTWTRIYNPACNTGSFKWDVGSLDTGSVYLVRVTAIDTTGLSSADESDEVFSIIEGSFLIDATGHVWNVTHAVEVYGMLVENWRFGGGPDAIKPINAPQFFSPGETGYPSATRTDEVIGFERNGDARAYPLSVLNWHEVVNDWYGEEAIAVVY
jgi:hypothetical protein